MSLDAKHNKVGDRTLGAAPDNVSGRITLLLSSKSHCLASLFALFLHNGKGDEKLSYRDAVEESFNTLFQDRIEHVMTLLPDELINDQLGIIDHATHRLKEKMNSELRLKTILKLERLLSGCGKFYLIDYARVQLIRRKLDSEYPVLQTIADADRSQAGASKAKKMDALGQEFALLLASIAEASERPAMDIEEQYQSIVGHYTREPVALPTSNTSGDQETAAAFQALYVQEASIRRAFVKHCEALLTCNGSMLSRDRTMIDLLAASLNCEELTHTRLAA